MRYDIATGQEERRIQPVFSGKNMRIQSLDGLLATGHDGRTLFAAGSNGGRLACLRSTDNGDTWEDWAQSDQTFGLYSIGGMRNVTADGYVIGSFTDSATQTSSLASESKVYFWRVRAEKSAE
ncbi:MAG: hypothetical protein IT368_00325 [Candidatus Hydrogenedentes bacterium]|nr:hypothetical protein [Candidatus Hydrogenedentota bacterium]